MKYLHDNQHLRSNPGVSTNLPCKCAIIFRIGFILPLLLKNINCFFSFAFLGINNCNCGHLPFPLRLLQLKMNWLT
jgi:hypothetical protein